MTTTIPLRENQKPVWRTMAMFLIPLLLSNALQSVGQLIGTGDLPGYEEGLRALFTDERTKLEQCIAEWPEDIRSYAIRLAFGTPDQSK